MLLRSVNSYVVTMMLIGLFIVQEDTFQEPSRLLLRSNLFTQRVISTWNALPDEVFSAPTISTFKASLDSHWIDIGYGYEQRPRA